MRKEKRLPLLQVGLLLLVWGAFMATGAAGFNIGTGVAVLGTLIYLCTLWRKATC